MPPRHAGRSTARTAGDQLARIERLAEIVVGADLKADDAVDVFLQRGQQNDGHVRALGAQIPADIEPRSVREHDIEHHEIDLVRRQPLVQLVAACRKQHAEALTLDIAGEKLADLRIVVCDKNLAAAWSSQPSLPPRRGCNEAIFVTKLGSSAVRQCFDTKRAEPEMIGNVTATPRHDRSIESKEDCRGTRHGAQEEDRSTPARRWIFRGAWRRILLPFLVIWLAALSLFDSGIDPNFP